MMLSAFLFNIAPAVLWPYVAAAAVIVIGLPVAIRKSAGKLIDFAPLFFAIAMAIFGADHLTSAKFIAPGVPSWMPWHLFWAYFVGFALLAAALSLAANTFARQAALLLGIMIFLFVPMLHIPSCFAVPYDRTRLTIVFRDLALSAGALSFAAGSYASAFWRGLIAAARCVIAASLVYFGIQHFRFPSFAPGYPQEGPAIITMASWIPAHLLWAYLVGAILIGCGIALLVNWNARAAAIAVAITALVLVAVIYLPLTISRPSDIAGGLNYLAIHFALAGEMLFLAGALPASAAR